MSRSSALALALKIAVLLEEYSEKDLREAVDLLRKHGIDSDLLDQLALNRARRLPSEQRPVLTNAKPAQEVTSRAVLRLKDADPEKFRILAEFDSMVRRGQLLASHEDLRRFGERISKNFESRKSRKDTIGALMSVLADRPITEIEQQVAFAASLGVSGATDEYQRLAQFLITGKGDV